MNIAAALPALSVYVIMSNAQLDLSFHGNRESFSACSQVLGPVCVRLKLSLCSVSALGQAKKGRGRGREGNDWGCAVGVIVPQRETPSVVPEVSICWQQGCNVHKSTDLCVHERSNISIINA